MTLERMHLSIETVKDNIKILESIEPDDAGYDLQLEHEKFVLAALEKQIPETPLPYKGWEGKCPTCGVIFLNRSTNYCGNCGQALDWSSEE